MFEQKISYTPGGHHTLLTLRGAQGAARAEVWTWEGRSHGVIGFHSVLPLHAGHQAETCPLLGRCYPGDSAYRGGDDVARLWSANDRDGAWHELEQWYHAQLGALEIA